MRDKGWLPITLCAAAAALGVAVYLNAVHNPFVWDDRRTVVENASIRPPLDWRAVFYHDRFRPLVNASYAADYALGGLSVAPYHATGILLHALNVVLVFFIARRVLVRSTAASAAFAGASVEPGRRAAGGQAKEEKRGPPARDGERKARAQQRRAEREGREADGPSDASTRSAAAFAGAAVFAVHPMMSQAVGYVSGRAEVLCAVFFLAAVLWALAWVQTWRARWLVAAACAWLLALASKEVAVALPFVVAAYALFAPGLPAATRRRVAYGVGGAVVVIALAAAYRLDTLVRVENDGRAAFTWSNALLGLDTFRRYATMMLVPARQSIFHTARVEQVTAPAAVLVNGVLLAAIAAAAWKLRRPAPAAAFGLAWFLLLLVPSTLLLLVNVGEPMAEQRVYLAACGLAIAAGAGYWHLDEWLRRARGWSAAAPVALAACVMVLAPLTVARNRTWHDPVALWSEAVMREPAAWVPHFGLGDALRERGDFGAAATAYREAMRLRPEEPRICLPLATSLLLSGRPEEADTYFERAERLSAGGIEAPVGRALVARMTGRRDEARDRLEALARAHPDAVLPRQLLAEMYERDYGDRASALRACLELRAIAPKTAGVDECVRRNQQAPEEAR